MSDLLFDLPPSPSPRLRWLDPRALSTYRLDNGKWRCELNALNWADGLTEDEAIVNFCIETRIPHYSQEDHA